jgi:hypothetical protein
MKEGAAKDAEAAKVAADEAKAKASAPAVEGA